MATKLQDIVVKLGEYQDGQGNTKGRYQNVGALMQGDNGQFIIMNRWFSPAGVPNPENRDTVVLSCFDADRNNQGGQQQPQRQQQSASYQAQQPPQYDPNDPGF